MTDITKIGTEIIDDSYRLDDLKTISRKELEKRFLDIRQCAINWIDTAGNYSRNADFYRDLLIEIGTLFGREARIADDGTESDDVLCLKLPGLVKSALRDIKL